MAVLSATPCRAQESATPGARTATTGGCTADPVHRVVSAAPGSESVIAVSRLVQREAGDEIVVSMLDGHGCAGRLFAMASDRIAVRTNGLVTRAALSNVRAIRRHQPLAPTMRRSVLIGAVAGGTALGVMCMAAGASAGDDLAEPALKCGAAGAAAGASVGAIVALAQNAVGRYDLMFDRRAGSRPTRSVEIMPAVGMSAARLQIGVRF